MDIIERCKLFVKNRLSDEKSGHDWHHTLRVFENALDIVKKDGFNVDLTVVKLGALFHDVADHKFGYSDGDRENIIKNAIGVHNLSDEQINHVVYIANNTSFSKGKSLETLESKIVQDADRLDALGAIGIARAFTYGGFRKRDIYNIEGDNDTISHFYEKLLKLKDLMNTEAGKKEALQREQFMVAFLKQFFKEINEGEKYEKSHREWG